MPPITKHETKRSSGCMKKQAISNPVLISGLAGASVGGFGGNLAADLFWRKPTKTQRILSVLIGAGLGGVVTGGVVNALNKDPEQKPAVTKALNAGKDVVAQSGSSLAGNLPDDKGWGNLTPWGKAAYGDSSVGGLAGAYGWLVNKAKRSLPDLGDKDEGGTVPRGAASLGASALGALGGWKATSALLNGNAKRLAMIGQLNKIINDPAEFQKRNPGVDLNTMRHWKSQLQHGLLFRKDLGRALNLTGRTWPKLADMGKSFWRRAGTKQGWSDNWRILKSILGGEEIPTNLSSRIHIRPNTPIGHVPLKSRYRWFGLPNKDIAPIIESNFKVTNDKDIKRLVNTIKSARGGKGTLALKILGALAGQTAAGTAAENWLGHNTKYDTRLNQLRAAYSDTLGK